MSAQAHNIDRLVGVARDALLDHLGRDDARHALNRVAEELAALLGGRFVVVAIDGQGAARWATGDDSGLKRLPLERLGRQLGWLAVPTDSPIAALDAVLPTVSALLLRDAQTTLWGERAREAIAASAASADQWLSRIAGHVPGILYIYRLEADGWANFPYVSERSRDLFELAPEELMRDAAALFRRIDFQDRQAMLDSITRSARTLKLWRLDFRLHRRDGLTRWIHGESSPIRQDDGAIVWHGYMEDVTERRGFERARHEAAVAAAANRAKTEFLSRMSHELRTPLNAVLGFTQLIEIDRAEPPTEGQQRRLRLIREAGEHLLEMISDLLDLTRIESGSMALQIDSVALRVAAEEALDMLRATAEKAQVQLRMAPGGDDAVARADRTRLRQVLLNLLSNAVKYNRPGGSVELRVLKVDAREMLISVRDSGVGIAEADMPHLFEPFHRGAQTDGAIEGAGIGLSVTQALVTLMQGRIEVHSTPGAGSTFSVALPAAD